jgi:hypothetical protein
MPVIPVARAITRITCADLIVVDDIGMLPVGPTPPKAATGWSTPPTSDVPWPSLATSTRPASTSSCQDPCHRHSGLAVAPRPRLRHPRRVLPARPSHHGKGVAPCPADALGETWWPRTGTPAATSGGKPWSPAGRSASGGKPWSPAGAPLTASGEKPVTVDNVPGRRSAFMRGRLSWPRDQRIALS